MSTVQTNVEIINLSRRAFLGAAPAIGLLLAVGFPRLALAAARLGRLAGASARWFRGAPNTT